jgi:AP-2 complex subunit alpha
LCLMSSEHYDPDVQQRGVEFNQLLGEDETIRRKILTRNPPYS